MKISLIIPVHNTKVIYLNELLLSLSQLNKEFFEVLVVDDGSDDEELKKYYLCDFPKSFSLIKLDKNYGVSHARNIGIKRCSGDYITFVDSDDLINVDLLQNIGNFQLSKDLYIFGFQYIDDRNINPSIKLFSEVFTKKTANELYCFDFRNDEPFNNFIFKSACSRFFKKSFLISNDIIFDEELRYSEDELFMANCLINNPTTSFFENVLYFYYMNYKSASRTFNKAYLANLSVFYLKYISLVGDDEYLLLSIHLEIFTIFLFTRVLICTKKLKLNHAFKMIKSEVVFNSAEYMLKTKNYLSKQQIKIANKIINKHYFIAFLCIMNDRIKKKIKHG